MESSVCGGDVAAAAAAMSPLIMVAATLPLHLPTLQIPSSPNAPPATTMTLTVKKRVPPPTMD
jgi:hypothetical protein